MAKSSAVDKILAEKKKRFLKAVKRICDKRELPEPEVNFEGCEGEDSDRQLAHYHPDSHMICCSKNQLTKLSFDDIDHVAAHEVSHILEQNHDGKFRDEEGKSGVAGFDPHSFPGVVAVNGKNKPSESKPEKKVKDSKTHCNYHLCKKRTRLYKCKYCKRYFCKEHVNAKEPGHRNVDGSPSPYFITKHDWEDTDGHPCPDYVGVEEKKKSEAENKYMEALDILSGKKKVYVFEPPKQFSQKKESSSKTFPKEPKTESKPPKRKTEIIESQKVNVHEVLTEFFNIELNEFIAKFSNVKITDIVQTGGTQEIFHSDQHPFKKIIDILVEYRNKLFGVTSPLRHKVDKDVFMKYFTPFIEFYVQLLIKRNMFNDPTLNKEFDKYFLQPSYTLFTRLNKRFKTTQFTDTVRKYFNSIPNLMVKIQGSPSLVNNKKIYVLEYIQPDFGKHSKRRMFGVLNTDQQGVGFFKLPQGLYDVYVEDFKDTFQIHQEGNEDKQVIFNAASLLGFKYIKPKKNVVKVKKPGNIVIVKKPKKNVVKVKESWIKKFITIILILIVLGTGIYYLNNKEEIDARFASFFKEEEVEPAPLPEPEPPSVGVIEEKTMFQLILESPAEYMGEKITLSGTLIKEKKGTEEMYTPLYYLKDDKGFKIKLKSKNILDSLYNYGLGKQYTATGTVQKDDEIYIFFEELS